MTVVLLMAVARIDGGWNTIWHLGSDAGKFEMFDMRFDLTHRANFFSAAAFGIFVYLPAKAISLGTVQRFVSLPTIAAARRCVVVNALLVSAICLLFFLVGTTLFVFYHQPGANGFPALASTDQLLPVFVVTEIPYLGLTGLLVAGLFAAAMSSIDSGINSLTLTIVIDWMQGRRPGVTFSRWLCASFGLLTIGASLLVPVLGRNVFDIVIKISGALFGPMLGLFLLAMWCKRANSIGAWTGFISGAGVLTIVLTMTNVSHWWYGAFTCIPTLVVGWIASVVLAGSVEQHPSSPQFDP
jgi:Na+/proline symporter